MIDILIICSSTLLGIICSLFVFQIIKLRRESRIKFLGNVKYELNNLFFEKSIALEALNRINQYFEENKIDIYEKDRLSHKYINLLNDYDKRIFQLNPVLEAQEIYEYRNQLNSILSDYIKKIDSKLTEYAKNNDKLNSMDTIKNKKESIVSSIKHPNSLFLNKIKSIIFSSETNKVLSKESRMGEKVNHEQKDNMEQQVVQTKESEIETENESQITHRNLDLSEIDKIQSDILKTLKRLEE